MYNTYKTHAKGRRVFIRLTNVSVCIKNNHNRHRLKTSVTRELTAPTPATPSGKHYPNQEEVSDARR